MSMKTWLIVTGSTALLHHLYHQLHLGYLGKNTVDMHQLCLCYTLKPEVMCGGNFEYFSFCDHSDNNILTCIYW